MLPFGPVSFEDAIVDTFYYEDVKESHCVGSVATNICKKLLETSYLEGTKYLVVCCPSYNEEIAEMMKTLLSTMRSFHFMRKKVIVTHCFALSDHDLTKIVYRVVSIESSQILKYRKNFKQ